MSRIVLVFSKKFAPHTNEMVVEGEQLTGIITLKDMLKSLALKVNLEENEEIKLPES